MPPCHGGDHRFDPGQGRKNRKTPNWRFFIFMIPKRDELADPPMAEKQVRAVKGSWS